MTEQVGAHTPGSRARLTVSLDPDVASWLRHSAGSAGANVSEYVEGLIQDRRARDDWMARWIAATGEPDLAALAAARRNLLGEDTAHDHGAQAS